MLIVFFSPETHPATKHACIFLFFFQNSSLIAKHSLKPVGFDYFYSTNTGLGAVPTQLYLHHYSQFFFLLGLLLWSRPQWSFLFKILLIVLTHNTVLSSIASTLHMVHGVSQYTHHIRLKVFGVQVQKCFLKHSELVVWQVGYSARCVSVYLHCDPSSHSLCPWLYLPLLDHYGVWCQNCPVCLMARCGKPELNFHSFRIYASRIPAVYKRWCLFRYLIMLIILDYTWSINLHMFLTQFMIRIWACLTHFFT